MTMKKTERVPMAADGVPLVVHSPHLDKTRELPACETIDMALGMEGGQPGAPREIVDDEVTVPVQSSIESSLTYELLRRQSTQDDDEDGHEDGHDKKP
jgi:hypothetical protein